MQRLLTLQQIKSLKTDEVEQLSDNYFKAKVKKRDFKGIARVIEQFYLDGRIDINFK